MAMYRLKVLHDHTAELVVCAYLLNYLVLFKSIPWNCLGVSSGFGI